MPDFFVHPTAVVDENCKIGDGSKVWHFCHLMSGCSLGSHCVLGQNVMLGPGVKIGNNVKVQNNVSLYSGVSCEDDVFIGPSAVFTNVINPRSMVNRKDEFKTTLVGRGASIGANATIICGHRIGAYSFIGAGSVVTKDVEDYSIVKGNPARRSGWMSEQGFKLNFDEDGFAVCEGSGESYQLKDGKVSRLI